MCGRYALALRASQIRQMLEEDDMPVADAPDDEGAGSARQSFNFAPGYHGVVYRADTPDWGAGEPGEPAAVRYRLQAMRWGLIPSWTKRSPDYATVMRTINCRDDSLAAAGGMWATMKARKRCLVLAQGFFEWLKTGPRHRLPHYVKRRDGRLMCFAGLWDCVQYEGSEEKTYSYTIITTDSNKQLRFLHDRMPVLFDPGSDDITTWLDPARREWDRPLQALLRPFDGELDVYPVSQDVGKVGNNSPSFVIPLDSKENRSNIANFFAKTAGAKTRPEGGAEGPAANNAAVEEAKQRLAADDDGDAHGSPEKRKASSVGAESPPPKKKAAVGSRERFDPTRNKHRSPAKTREPGSQKITKFFGGGGGA
ncbi:hypothetical protein CDD83_2337 [Cordyceps sp. RAO-2017]|nr:hypothetical protein CDD83_2337 [Cordyceps sp. RAO-2017]